MGDIDDLQATFNVPMFVQNGPNLDASWQRQPESSRWEHYLGHTNNAGDSCRSASGTTVSYRLQISSTSYLDVRGYTHTDCTGGRLPTALGATFESVIRGRRIQLTEIGFSDHPVNGQIDNHFDSIVIGNQHYTVEHRPNDPLNTISLIGNNLGNVDPRNHPFHNFQFSRVGGQLVFSGPRSQARQGAALARDLNGFEALYQNALHQGALHVIRTP